MSNRGGPVHVATTKRKYKGKTYKAHLLRRTFRQDGKVKHETVGNISHLPEPVIELVRRALSGGVDFSADSGVPGGTGDEFSILRTLPHGHVAAVLGTLRKIGVENVLASRPCEERTLVVAMIAARVIDPCSKLATARSMHAETASTSLGSELGLDRVTENDLYGAMDWLVERQARIERKLAKKHLHDGTLVLYDVSSSFYTGSHCPLAEFGYNRDGKNGYKQIVYGLLCSKDGCPIAIEVFEGNTSDPGTLSSQVTKLRDRFGLKRLVLVGDRGMITSKRIDEDLKEVEGLDWITALRADSIKKLATQGVVQSTLFDERDLAEVTSDDYPGERLILCRNPLLAEERSRKRQDLLKATEKKLDEVVQATQRSKRKLKGKVKISLRVDRVINRYKVGKHFEIDVHEDRFTYRRKQEKIDAEAALDGIYIIRTSVPAEDLDADSTVQTYKDLAKVERAFRSLKTIDLKVRPIHHRLEDRVRAHVFLCMLAYYVEWHMRTLLAPILFDDDDHEAAKAARASVVAPAQRSAKAKLKDATKRTEDDKPVHSFRTLLKDLATLAKNHVRTGAQHEFDVLTQKTDLQNTAFELLGVSP